jgi:hypothetical protein
MGSPVCTGPGSKKPQCCGFFVSAMYYIYILHSDIADKFYVGFSSNPWNRTIQHNTNSKEKLSLH